MGLVAHRRGAAGFDPTVTRWTTWRSPCPRDQELEVWVERLEDKGVAHSGIIDVPLGAILKIKDPDGIALAFFWDR